jgi:hypothetical protein
VIKTIDKKSLVFAINPGVDVVTEVEITNRGPLGGQDGAVIRCQPRIGDSDKAAVD